ncbi:MAG: cytochrome c [Acidobacteria bacterium]|nr:cytochrome c [Acidobacteriota bacterium]
MNRSMLHSSILVFMLCNFSTDCVRAQQGVSASPGNTADQAARAKEIYRRDCLVCHGANGDGKTDILRDRELNLPDWTDRRVLIGRVDQQLFNVIRFGRGKMPAESAGRADDGEVRGLIRYIRTLSRDEARATPEPGRAASKK